VFDVMASPSLLITEHHPDSDLFRLFGEDCPVPMYKSFDHLRELCRHYLAHEDERLARVATCNALVGGASRISSRLSEMLAVAGVRPPLGSRPAKPYEIVDTRRLYGMPRTLDRAAPWVRLTGKRLGKVLAGPILRLQPSAPN
jgi:hypothetical protein